jgi:hypothetical protein
MKTRDLLRDVWEDIRNGKNIDVYIAVILNAFLAILSILDVVPPSILTGTILASVSWLSLNVLLERKDSKTQKSELVREIRAIGNQGGKSFRAAEFFKENYVHNSPEFQDSFKTSSDVIIFGMSQNRMITAYGEQIRRILSEGGNVKFIVTEPDGIGTEMSIKRGSTPGKVDSIRLLHWGALERLKVYPKGPTCKGSLEVKLIDLLPPYTMYGFDMSDSIKGRIYVWLTPFREPSENRPGFVLSPLRDPEWFAFFRHQFKRLWEWEEAKEFPLV